ncbi:MAG: hypothetical protein CL868_00560 [Cytophagaceae bacterium]|nr:hypothetical protein [Cytophagaceae bacterium]
MGGLLVCDGWGPPPVKSRGTYVRTLADARRQHRVPPPGNAPHQGSPRRPCPQTRLDASAATAPVAAEAGDRRGNEGAPVHTGASTPTLAKGSRHGYRTER